MFRTPIIIAATVAALAAVCVAAPAFGQQGECLSNRQLYQAIESGSVPNVSDVAASAGLDTRDISAAELCADNGSWVYRLRLGKRTGVGRTLVLPAGS